MGNQVCALGPEPDGDPLLLLATEKTRPANVRGETNQSSLPAHTTTSLRYKMTQRHIRQNTSGKVSLGPCQLKAGRWGSVSVSSV